MKTAVFTSTLDADLLKWLELESRSQNQTRRDILEQALREYKREQMKKGFLRARNDLDVLEMVEWGMREYVGDSGL